MSLLALMIILTLPFSLAHMSMQYPYPRDNNGAYPKWKANEPMITVHPTICHGLAADSTVREGNTFTAGDTINIHVYGAAPHGGGHCSFWYSTDDITFTKIIDIKDCTINSTSVILPSTMPTQCTTKCTFAFTWVPVDSGACEIYMNCADIQVTGASGGNSNPISLNFQSSFIDKSGSGYGCIRVDAATHWTSIFGTLKTEYGVGEGANGVEISDGDVEPEICYLDASLAINLGKEIGASCGVSDVHFRCDVGMCCSALGYCGPEYDGSGWVNYDLDGYYESETAAFAAYCNNAIGDWRVVTCEDDGFVSAKESKINSAGLGVAIFMVTVTAIVLIVAVVVTWRKKTDC